MSAISTFVSYLVSLKSQFSIFNECKVVKYVLIITSLIYFSAINQNKRKFTGFSLLHDLDSSELKVFNRIEQNHRPGKAFIHTYW